MWAESEEIPAEMCPIVRGQKRKHQTGIAESDFFRKKEETAYIWENDFVLLEQDDSMKFRKFPETNNLLLAYLLYFLWPLKNYFHDVKETLSLTLYWNGFLNNKPVER